MTTSIEQSAPPTAMRASVLKYQGEVALETIDVPVLEADQVLNAGKQPGQLNAAVDPGC